MRSDPKCVTSTRLDDYLESFQDQVYNKARCARDYSAKWSYDARTAILSISKGRAEA